jgi:hypothetical protein
MWEPGRSGGAGVIFVSFCNRRGDICELFSAVQQLATFSFNWKITRGGGVEHISHIFTSQLYICAIKAYLHYRVVTRCRLIKS